MCTHIDRLFFFVTGEHAMVLLCAWESSVANNIGNVLISGMLVTAVKVWRICRL
jgi:hypothetical protein